MPPKKRVPKVAEQVEDTQGDEVADSGPSKSKKTKKNEEGHVESSGDGDAVESQTQNGVDAEKPVARMRQARKAKEVTELPPTVNNKRGKGTKVPSEDLEEEPKHVTKRKGQSKSDDIPTKKMSKSDDASSKRGTIKQIKPDNEEDVAQIKKEKVATKKQKVSDKKIEMQDKEMKETGKKEKALAKKETGSKMEEAAGAKKVAAAVKKEAAAAKKEEAAAKKEKAAAKKEKTTDNKQKAPKKTTKTEEDKESTSSEIKNQTSTDWQSLNFDCKKKNAEGKLPNLKITSWNVDGLRSWLKKGCLDILKYGLPDILCLQETKCADDQLPREVIDIEGYHKYWCASNKSGYAGVGLLSKVEPINIEYGIGNEEHDEEGRCITAEFEDFYLVSVYVPNAGRKLVTLDKRLDWNEVFKQFIEELDKQKPVIICGDLNVAHNEIDLKNPKTNTKNAGFTQEERDGLTNFLEEAGFVDSFRALYPDEKDVYTFWTYMMNARKKNIGWRLDYFLISKRLKDKVCDNIVHDKVFGSDHCPITLFIKI